MNDSVLTHECRNCHHHFVKSVPVPPYCPQCGQETVAHPPTVYEFLHEFLLHYVALEGKLWKTLGLLFFKPGVLTIRYLAGIKRQYVPPLRIYLTASILFFLIIKFFGAGNLVKTDLASSNKAAVAAEKNTVNDAAAPLNDVQIALLGNSSINLKNAPKDFLNSPASSAITCNNASAACSKVSAYFNARYPTQTVIEMGRIVRDKMLSLAPYAMFFFLPVFALLLKVTYLRRGMYYGEHLVYAFHVHTFAYFLLLALAFSSSNIAEALTIVGAVYFWFAMKRVYGGRWWANTLRFMTISMLYPILLTLLMSVTLLIAVFL
jgi:Protein of unknown function (DUF3667)